MKIALIIGLIILMTGFVVAESVPKQLCEFNLEEHIGNGFTKNGQLTAEYDKDVKMINSWTTEFPSIIRNSFGNERMNIYLTMNSGKKHTIGIKTNNAKIQLVQYGAMENPSLNVYVNESTVQNIYCAENRITALQNAVLTKEITYEGTQVDTVIKTTIIDAVLNFFRFFNLFTGWTTFS